MPKECPRPVWAMIPCEPFATGNCGAFSTLPDAIFVNIGRGNPARELSMKLPECLHLIPDLQLLPPSHR